MTHYEFRRRLALLLALSLPVAPTLAHDRHHGHVGIGVVIGAPLFGPWYSTYPYEPVYRPYVPAAPPVYVEQGDPAGGYWYRCEQPAGYFPYVSQCPGGWLKVLPPPPPPR